MNDAQETPAMAALRSWRAWFAARPAGVVVVLLGLYLPLELYLHGLIVRVAADPLGVELSWGALEVRARAIASLGVGLAVARAVVSRSVQRAGWRALAAGSVAAAIFYVVQGAALSAAVDATGGSTRQRAAAYQLVAGALSNPHVGAPELGVPSGTGERSGTTAYRALLGLVALTGTATPDSETVRASAEIVARQKVGSARAVWNQRVQPRLSELRQLYDVYRQANERVKKKWEQWREKADEAWDKYVRRHFEQGIAGDRVLRALRENGMELEGLPHRTDAGRRRFDRAFAAAYRERLKRAYEGAIAEKFGVRLPLGLSWGEFLRHPAVKDRVSAGAVPCDPADMQSFERFQACYDNAMAGRASELVGAATAPAAAYVTGDHVAEGRDAVRRVLIPAVALCLSTVLLVVNGAGFAADLMRRGRGRRWAGHLAGGSVAAAAAIAAWLAPALPPALARAVAEIPVALDWVVTVVARLAPIFARASLLLA